MTDLVRQEIATRSVVLMETMDGNSAGFNATGFRDSRPPGVVPRIAKAHPIDGDERNRGLVAR